MKSNIGTDYALLGQIVDLARDVPKYWEILLKVVKKLRNEDSDEHLFASLLGHILTTKNQWFEEGSIITPLWGHGNNVARNFRIVRSYHSYISCLTRGRENSFSSLGRDLDALEKEFSLSLFSSADISLLTKFNLDKSVQNFYHLGISRAIFMTEQDDDQLLIYEDTGPFKDLFRRPKEDFIVRQSDVFVFLAK